MRQPVLLHRAEVSLLERIECDRIAAWTYTEIREKFLKNQIPWSQIPTLKAKSKPISLPEVNFQVPSLFSRSVKRLYTLETLREKQDKEGQTIRLVTIHIEIGTGAKKRQFSYQVNVIKQT